MAIIKLLRLLLFTCLLASTSLFAENSLEQTQTLQIYTNFKSMVGKPSWLLIIRDVETGLVSPYLFEIKNNDNFWVAFTYGHHYQITASTLTFGKYATIHNFCCLENGVISGKSMYMMLTGALAPDPQHLLCNVTKYNDSKFTIVKKED